MASSYTNTAVALLLSGAIFPLYIYPGDCTPWGPVFSAIQVESIIQFYIVINPNSGPNGAPGSQPDVNYQTCITKLRTVGAVHGNLKILGYVATGNGTRPSQNVIDDIDTYSEWSSQYRPDGIFFDEVSNDGSFLNVYQTYSSRVHSDFGTGFVMLNPGTTPLTSDYFNIADLIVTFEGFYNDFNASDLTIGPATPSHRQVVILHDGPTRIPFQIVDELAEIIGLGASFITDFPNAIAYENIPTDWNSFCASLIPAQTA